MQVTEYYKKAFHKETDGQGGFEHWSNRSKYDGEFRYGEKHGKGKLVWQDQSTYQGQWQNGLMDGEGLQTFPDGKCYKGEYFDNKFSG